MTLLNIGWAGSYSLTVAGIRLVTSGYGVCYPVHVLAHPVVHPRVPRCTLTAVGHEPDHGEHIYVCTRIVDVMNTSSLHVRFEKCIY